MKSRGIKPILGCELYICDQDASLQSKENRSLSHLLVLAKNYDGWQSLIKIVSESNKPEHYYHKPRLDLNRLGEMLDGNLIGICGHLGSTLANKIVENDTIVSDYSNVNYDFMKYSNINDVGKQWIRKYTLALSKELICLVQYPSSFSVL